MSEAKISISDFFNGLLYQKTGHVEYKTDLGSLSKFISKNIPERYLDHNSEGYQIPDCCFNNGDIYYNSDFNNGDIESFITLPPSYLERFQPQFVSNPIIDHFGVSLQELKFDFKCNNFLLINYPDVIESDFFDDLVFNLEDLHKNEKNKKDIFYGRLERVLLFQFGQPKIVLKQIKKDTDESIFNLSLNLKFKR